MPLSSESATTASPKPFPRFRRSHAWRDRTRRAGMTLIELIIGMSVIGTACLGGLSGMLFTLRVADSNLLALSASSAVRAVAEQLHAVDYAALFAPQLPVDVPSNPGGSLTADSWNVRTDDLHRTPNDPRDDLQLRINPVITRVRDANGLDYAMVVIRYEWQDSSFFTPRTRSDTFSMIMSRVSSY